MLSRIKPKEKANDPNDKRTTEGFIPQKGGTWNAYVNDRLTEWNFKQQWIDEMIFKPKNVTLPEEAFSFMDRLIPSRENAFLLRRK